MAQKLVLAPSSTTVNNIATFATTTGQIKDSGVGVGDLSNGIVQTVVNTSSTNDTTTNTSLTNTSLTLDITPTSTSNVLIAYCSCPILMPATAGSTLRGGTMAIYSPTVGIFFAQSTYQTAFVSSTGAYPQWRNCSLMGRYTPASISTLTVKVRFAALASNQIELLGSTYGPAFLVVQEVAL